MPLGLAALLLLVAVWLGTRILENMTDALTAIAAGEHDVPVRSAWPDR